MATINWKKEKDQLQREMKFKDGNIELLERRLKYLTEQDQKRDEELNRKHGEVEALKEDFRKLTDEKTI